MTISKKKIVDELLAITQSDLDNAKSAFDTTHGHATDKELNADGKYDTRSVEAGYLAGAQQKRVSELEHEVELLKEINLEHELDSISVGSMVEIEFNNISRHYFISSTAGGTILNIDDCPILVISAFSPIGSEAIGLQIGETFEVEVASGVREYKINSIS